MIELGYEIQAIWGWPLPHVTGESGPGLGPSSQWDGSPASGFGTSPSDPQRLTAKPAVRLLEPPYQRFTASLTVGVAAFALDGTTLIGGIDRVRFHFEGNVFDVIEPTFRKLTREDGSTYDCLGYWVNLRKPGSRTGEAHLYVEAVPADATMQNRVIGPYPFFPSDTQHDWKATCGVGGDYSDLRSALNAARSAAAASPLIELTDSTDYLIATNPLFHEAQSYTTIRAAGGARPRLKRAVGDENEIRLRHARIWFEGIEFDCSTITRVRGEGGGHFVAKRCRIADPNGRSLFLKALRPVSWFFDGNPYFLETAFSGGYQVCNGAMLIRGVVAEQCYGDFSNQPSCAVHSICNDLNDEGVAGELDALIINYSGDGTAAVSGTDSGSGVGELRNFAFLVDGSPVASFPAWRHYSRANAGDGLYEVQDLADFINGLPGWSATVLDNNRQAASLTLGGQGGFGANDFPATAVGTGLTLASDFGLHQDGFVNAEGGADENIILFANRITQAEGQLAFTGGAGSTTTLADYINVNNLYEQPAGSGLTSNLDQYTSASSHIVFAHNTWSRQIVALDFSAIVGNAHCLFSNNVCDIVRGSVGDQVGDNNHVQSDGTGLLAEGLTNTVQAGTRSTLYADPDALDFSPAGELLANPKLPVVPFDLDGIVREGSVPVGAMA